MKRILLSRKYFGLLLVLFGLGFAACSSSTSTPASSDVVNGVYKPTSSPYGSTYAQWSAKWWQWAYQTKVHDNSTPPKVTHPLRDSTGAYASNGQDPNSSVFFLGGWLDGNGTYVRTVTIPASKALFIPLANVEADTTATYHWTIDSVNAAINGIVSTPVTLSATLDGVTIPNLPTYTARSDAFSVTLPVDNAFQFAGLTYPAGTVISPIVSFGYWLMLAPLATGTHTLHVVSTVTSLGLMQDITYHITSN